MIDAVVFLLRYTPKRPAHDAEAITLISIWNRIFNQRWNPLVTGALVGIIGMIVYFRIEPLGVTSKLAASHARWLTIRVADRLNGLDDFAGCATVVVQTITENGWLIGGLVAGSFAVVLLANRFQLSQLTLRNSATALLGGVLMGWGSMLSLGCTVGMLLSGISAFAISGWVFAMAVFEGAWLGIKLQPHQ